MRGSRDRIHYLRGNGLTPQQIVREIPSTPFTNLVKFSCSYQSRNRSLEGNLPRRLTEPAYCRFLNKLMPISAWAGAEGFL